MHCIYNLCLLAYILAGRPIIFRRRSSSADLDKFCLYANNCNFVTMVGLTNGERMRRNTGILKELW